MEFEGFKLKENTFEDAEDEEEPSEDNLTLQMWAGVFNPLLSVCRDIAGLLPFQLPCAMLCLTQTEPNAKAQVHLTLCKIQ